MGGGGREQNRDDAGDDGLEGHRDDELLALAREGDEAAIGVLFARHRTDAVGIAARVVDRHEAEDAVNDALERILGAFRAGRGPTVAFRPYLNTAVHHAAIDRLRRQRRHVLAEPDDLVPLLVESDLSGRRVRDQVVRSAFASLPTRWQHVLWLSEVERLPHDETGELLGLSPNAVAALAVRARRGLADAYLGQYVGSAPSDACQVIADRLPGYLNGTLTPARRKEVEEHLASCASCRAALRELEEARTDVGALILPLAALVAWPAGAAVAPVPAPSPSPAGSAALNAAVGVAAALTAAGVVAAVALGGGGPPRETDPRPVASATSRPADAGPRPAAGRPSPTVRAADPVALVTSAAADDPTGRTTVVEVGSGPPHLVPAGPTAAGTSPTPSPAPTTTVPTQPSAGVDPRLMAPVVIDSPRGAHWYRVVVEAIGTSTGDQIALSGTGGSIYCLASCDSVDPAATWLSALGLVAPPASVTLDVHTDQVTTVVVELVDPGWPGNDPADDRQRVILVPDDGASPEPPLQGPVPARRAP